MALHNHVKNFLFLELVWSAILKQKNPSTINSKGTSARVRDFRGPTIKQLGHYVIPILVDDNPDRAAIRRGCNDLNDKKKQKFSDDIVNIILDISKLYQSHGVNSIILSNLIYRKNNFQWRCHTINKLSRNACDSFRLFFIENSNIARNLLASEETHLKYGGTDVLCKNIAFYLNNFLWNKASKNIVSSDQHIQQKIDENNANFPTSLGYSGTLMRIMLTFPPLWDTVEHWWE